MSPSEVPADRLIERVRSPHNLKALSGDEVDVLAADIRDFLVEKVARTGGHLGPNLGVVEITGCSGTGSVRGGCYVIRGTQAPRITVERKRTPPRRAL